MEKDKDLFIQIVQALLQKTVSVETKEIKDQNGNSGVIYLPKRLVGKIALVITEEIPTEDENERTDSSG